MHRLMVHMVDSSVSWQMMQDTVFSGAHFENRRNEKGRWGKAAKKLQRGAVRGKEISGQSERETTVCSRLPGRTYEECLRNATHCVAN